MNRPAPVTFATTLMWIGAVVSALLGIASLIAAGDAAKVAADLHITSPSEIDGLRTALIIAGIFLLIVAAIDALFASRIGRGSKTARLIYTILGGLSSLGAISSAIATHQTSHWFTAVLPLAIIAMLWFPASSKQFFEQGK